MAECKHALRLLSGSSNSVHQFGDGQVETLSENVKRVETRLFGAVFKKMQERCVQPRMFRQVCERPSLLFA